MPSATIPGGLLALAKGNMTWPWNFISWQTITGVNVPPWDPDGTQSTGWTSDITNKVVSFVRNYWSKADSEQYLYMQNKKDNDQKGRETWKKWVTENWDKRWKMNRKIDEALENAGFGYYQLMKETQRRTLPELGDVEIRHADIAQELFGDDAWINPDTQTMLQPEIKKFINVLLANTWNRYRKAIARDHKAIVALEEQISAGWLDLTNPDKAPTQAKIRVYLARVEKLMILLQRYGDVESTSRIELARSQLNDMLAGLGMDARGGSATKLPPALRNALIHLASVEQVQQLQTMLISQIDMLAPDAEIEQAPFLDFEDVDEMDWTEGVEELQHVSVDELWARLGFQDHRVPFFNQRQDPYGIHDPWAPEDRKWFENTDNTEIFQPRWHQLVGIYRMVQRAFAGEPILLMDEVGLGKTLQVVGMICVLEWYRVFYEQHKVFPGEFGKKKFPSEDGNIPRTPSVLVVPVNLVNQMTSELHRYLRHGEFDVLPYLGTHKTRPTWWTDVWTLSKHEEHRRIVITTPNALASDYGIAFTPMNAKRPTSPPTRRPTESNTTIFDRDWRCALVDEAHNCRNFGKTYSAVLMLRTKAAFMVAMTATPVTTRPMDLWNLGRCLGLKEFDCDGADEESKLMQSQLKAALSRDRKQKIKSGTAARLIRGITAGEVNSMESEHRDKMIEWIQIIRERFKFNVIRRTHASVDCDGKPIAGLDPYVEHPLLLQLYPYEMESLDKVAIELAGSDANVGAMFASGKNFYLRVRRALTHPGLNNDEPTKLPESIAQWDAMKSKKLDTLAKLVKHHLAQDGAQPMEIVDNELVSDPKFSLPPTPDGQPDKIIVYCAFPSNNELIKTVLKIHEIDCIEVHGMMSTTQRSRAIDKFKNSDRNGPRVLILSQVGMTGLNLPVANILIMVDTLWSAQDDGQLIGRIWRHPQLKIVHVYRLIADKTSDVFLNNISFDKAQMHEAFTGSTPAMQTLFDPEDPIVEEDDDIVEIVNSDDKTAKRKKGKAKERATSKGDRKADGIDANPSKADTQRPKPRPKAKDPKSAEHISDSPSSTIGLFASLSSDDRNNNASFVAAQDVPDNDFNMHHPPPATPLSSPALTPPPATQPRHQVTPPPPPPSPPRSPSPDFSFYDVSQGEGSQEPGRKRKPTSPIGGNRAYRKEPFSSVAGSSRAPRVPRAESIDNDDDVPTNIGGVAGMISRSVNLGAGSVRGLPALRKNRGSRR